MKISKILKQFFWLIIPASIVLFALSSFIYNEENKKQRLTLTSGERVAVSFAKASVQRELDGAILDLRYLNDTIAGKNLSEITNLFENFSRNKKIYDQIRFLSTKGQELVRVNYRSNRIETVPEEALQSKKTRYYFKYSIVLQPGEVFISPLDLNVERNAIELPLKPVIRLGMVVYDDGGNKQGIVMLNYLAKDMLLRFRNHAPEGTGTLRLLNKDGFWLSHEEWEKEWGFMFGRNHRIQNRNLNEWDQVRDSDSGQFETENGLFTYSTVYPVTVESDVKRKEYFWKIIAHVPQKTLTAYSSNQMRLVGLIAVPIYIVVCILCAWLAYSRIQRQDVQRKLQQSEERNRAIVDTSLDAIITTDRVGRVTAWNPAAEKVFGYRASEALGQLVDNLIVPEEWRAQHSDALAKFAATGRTGVVGNRTERQAMRKDGSFLPVGIAVVAQNVSGELLLTAFIQDLTEQKMREEKDRLIKAVFDETLEGICICNENMQFVMVNKAFSEITGYRLHEVEGKTPAILSSGEHDADFYKNMWDTIEEHGSWEGEIWNRHAQGHLYPERISISTMKDQNGKVQNYFAVFNDISEKKAADEIIRKQAHFDTLTDLPNRFLFMDRLERAVAEAKRMDEMFALLFVDLDRFKIINDTHGHQAGDDMLVEVAKRLNSGVRESDSVARLAGDEFTIISRNLHHESDLENVIAKIEDSLCGIWHYDGLEILISGSVGGALFPRDGKDPDKLLQAADQAMYRAKQFKTRN